jgi:nucleoside transporter
VKFNVKSRLSVMMFLEFFVWGSWYVTLGTWLSTTLQFSAEEVGWAAGTTAVGAIVSPFFVGVIADRRFATQKILGVLHGMGALLLAAASIQHAFAPLYILVLLYCLCFMPTLALAAALALRQIRDPQREFGRIRVFGTLGWIVAGLIVGVSGLESTGVPMRIGAASSAVLAVFCFFLPDTPPLAVETGAAKALFPLESVRLLGTRSMAVFALASFLICIPLQFYYAFTNLFLNETGVTNAAAKMTGGQMSELFCMLLIPWFFRRLGVKYMLAVGMLAWAVRYMLFAFGDAHELMWMFWLGIALHGICFDFFFVVGQIYIDREAPPALRAATQGLITFITYGLGMFVGSLLSGRVVAAYTRGGSAGVPAHDWRSIWIVSAVASAVVLVLFLLSFRDEQPARALRRPSQTPGSMSV